MWGVTSTKRVRQDDLGDVIGISWDDDGDLKGTQEMDRDIRVETVQERYFFFEKNQIEVDGVCVGAREREGGNIIVD